MDLFELFLSFNTDFTLTISHKGGKAIVSFLPKIEKKEIPPVTISLDKGDCVDVAEVQAKIKEAIVRVANEFTPLADQFQTLKESLEKKASGKTVKEKAKKHDSKFIAINKKARETVNNKKSLNEMKSLRDEMLKLNKTKDLDVTDTLKKAFDKFYKELNTKIDAVEPSMFGAQEVQSFSDPFS